MSCTNDPRLEVWPSHKFPVLKGHCGRPAISLTHKRMHTYKHNHILVCTPTGVSNRQSPPITYPRCQTRTFVLNLAGDGCCRAYYHTRARARSPRHRRRQSLRLSLSQDKDMTNQQKVLPPLLTPLLPLLCGMCCLTCPLPALAVMTHPTPCLSGQSCNMPPACVGSHDPPNPLPEWAVM